MDWTRGIQRTLDDQEGHITEEIDDTELWLPIESLS